MPKADSIDELFANIDLDNFIKDYNNGESSIFLKEKYGINSNKGFQNFIKSLIKAQMVIEQKPNDSSKILLDNQYKNKSKKDIVLESESAKNISSYENTYDITNEYLYYLEDYTPSLPINSVNSIEEKNETVEIVNGNNNDQLSDKKTDFVKYWNLGLSKVLICQLLDINYITLQKWKRQLGLENKLSNTNLKPLVQIKKIEDEIIELKIIKLLNCHNHVLLLTEISEELGIPEKKIKDIIDDSLKIKTCRLSFFIPGESGTHYTVECFHSKAFSVIVYTHKFGLLLKVAEILLEHPNKNLILDNQKIKQIIDDLWKDNPYNDYKYDEINDLNIIISLINNLQFRNKYVSRIKSIQIKFDEREIELENLLLEWKKILTLIDRINNLKIDKISIDFPPEYEIDLTMNKKVRNTIINLLNLNQEKGINSISMYSILKKKFSINDKNIIRNILLKLLNDEIIVRSTYDKSVFYRLKKYHKETQIIEKGKIYGKDLDPESFISELILLKKGKLSSTEKNQVAKIAGIFLINKYTIRTDLNLLMNCDFACEKNNTITYVRIDIDNYISNNQINTLYYAVPLNSKLIIITLKKIDLNIKNYAKNVNIDIWDYDTLHEELLKIRYEPCDINSLSRIMYGKLESRYVKVNSTDFLNQQQEIELIDESIRSMVYFGSIRQLPLETNFIRYEQQFICFLKTLLSMSSKTEYIAGLRLNPIRLNKHLPNSYNKANYWKNNDNILNDPSSLLMESDSHHVKLNFDITWNGFIYHDQDNFNDNPKDFCKKYVTDCECFYWIDQNEPTLILCRHIVSVLHLLFEQWNSVKAIDQFIYNINKLNFFVHDIFIIHSFLLKIAEKGNTEIFGIIRYVLAMKGSEYSNNETDLTTLIKTFYINNKLTEKEIEYYLKDKSPLGRENYYKSQNFQIANKLLNEILKEIPEINSIFKKIPKEYLHGIQISLEEIIREFSNL